MEYIDGITIIDTSGIILFSVKFNPFWNEKVPESIVGKKLLDVFTDLNYKTSTLFQCMEYDKPITYSRQTLSNRYSLKAAIEGVSYPIKIDGNIVGAVEISREKEREGKKHISIEEQDIKDILNKGTVEFSNRARYTLQDIISENTEMKKQIAYAGQIADSPSPVLITGETGTGKELFAHGIHEASKRKQAPFIVQNCSAIPETLLESLLFGTCKGSFTGAVDRKGIFEIADGGTLFLDELHGMPLQLQAKLLRVIQDGFVRRIGAEKEKKVDVRIIAATNIDYQDVLNGNGIRRDLFYRLSVLGIQIPALKDRKDDIRPLAKYFIRKYNLVLKKSIEDISPQVYELLQSNDWPGNVRELENFIEACMNVVPAGAREITLGDVPDSYKEKSSGYEKRNLKETLETLEFKLIRESLIFCRGNVSEAAKSLGLPRQTLQQKMKKYKMKT